MRERHVEAVAALSARCFERGATADELSAELARDVSTALVAERDGVVVGYAILWVVAGEGELHAIGVDPGARNEGVGRALMDAVLARAPVVHLEVRVGNVAARALYERAGLEVVDVRRRYYSNGEDALIMTRRS